MQFKAVLMLPDESHNFINNDTDDGFEELFNELFREYEHSLYLLSLKMLKSDALAKDIVQDIFLKLWTMRDKIAEIKNISSFLYRLTENKIIDYLRASSVDKKRREGLWQITNENVEHSQNVFLEKKELHTILQRAVEQLPPQRKAVYLLSKDEGISRSKVASLLNISPNTVKNQLSKAMANITRYFKNYID